MAFGAQSPIELVDAAVAGRLDIPEFQRGFVWAPEKVKNLLDSLCRDYPIGSVLCWRSESYQSPRQVSSTEPERVWIVDGQQRTTALCLLIGKKPFWFPSPQPWDSLYQKCDVRINLLSDPEEIELSLANPVIDKSGHWMSARELLRLPENDVARKTMELLISLKKSPTDTEELGRLMSLINALQRALRREIVVVEISHDPVDVAEIFGRLNSAGTRVNEGDVALALIAVRQEGWVKNKLLPYLEDLKEEGFDFDPSFIIRVMAAIRRGSGRLKDIPREFWEESDDFRKSWERTKDAVTNVVRVLRGLGILSGDILPSRNALIPLFILDDRYFKGDAASLRRAFLWFLRATRDARYSGSAITTLDQDLSSISASPDGSAALGALEAKLEVDLGFRFNDMYQRYDESQFLRLMLYLVAFSRRAEDWKTGQALGFDRSDNSLNDGFRPEWHHFFPRGLLKRRKPDAPAEDLVNAIANIVVLGEGDNRRFSYSAPLTYLAKYAVPDARVHQQVFPDKSLWVADSFEEFLAQRSRLLADAMNQYIQSFRP